MFKISFIVYDILLKSVFLNRYCIAVCGVRGTKGPKQRPSVDPELAPKEDSPSRKIGRRINQKRKKTGSSKSRKNKARARRKVVSCPTR